MLRSSSKRLGASNGFVIGQTTDERPRGAILNPENVIMASSSPDDGKL